MSVLQLNSAEMSIKKKVHIIPACLLKTRQLLKVCVEHSTHGWERWDQVVKFPPYKGPWQTTVSSSSLNTVALMQLDWLWFCKSMSQNDLIRFHSINLTSNSSCVTYPSRWRSPKNMTEVTKKRRYFYTGMKFQTFRESCSISSSSISPRSPPERPVACWCCWQICWHVQSAWSSLLRAPYQW